MEGKAALLRNKGKSSELEGAEITNITSFEFEKKMIEWKSIQSPNFLEFQRPKLQSARWDLADY